MGPEFPRRQGELATENAWRAIADEFGLITSDEVTDLLGHEASERNIIKIQLSEGILYPCFQFDRTNGTVLPAIPKLIEIGEKYGLTQEGLTQWLCAGTGQLEGRPVDHLTEVDLVVEAAENHYGIEW